MWYGSKNTISQHHLCENAMLVLERAAQDCIEFDMRRHEVYKALDYLEQYATGKYGFRMFREGLDSTNPELRMALLIKAVAHIRTHLDRLVS